MVLSHFIVVYLVDTHLIWSEAEGDLVVIVIMQYLVNMITKFTFEKQQGLYHNKERASIWRTNYSQFFFFYHKASFVQLWILLFVTKMKLAE